MAGVILPPSGERPARRLASALAGTHGCNRFDDPEDPGETQRDNPQNDRVATGDLTQARPLLPHRFRLDQGAEAFASWGLRPKDA